MKKERLQELAGLQLNEAPQQSLDLTWSVKPDGSGTTALVYLETKKFPIGEANKADFVEKEYREEMEQWVASELKRVSKRFTKKFG